MHETINFSNMKKDEDYIKETELRKARNYNARMDIWNDPKTKADSKIFGYGCVLILLFIALLAAIFNWA